MAAGPIDHRQLTAGLTKHFSLGDLRELASRLDIDFDDLPGKSPAQKSEELVSRVEKVGRREVFIDYIRKMRPNVPFTEFGDMDFEVATKSGSPQSQARQVAPSIDSFIGTDSVDFGEMPDLQDEGVQATLSEIEDTEVPSPEKSIDQLGGILLTTSSGVKIYALQTERPWTLPVDAFVIPFGFGGGGGGLAESLTNFLGESEPGSFATELHAQVSVDLQPDTPVLLKNWRLPNTDRRLIAATAFSPDASTASIEGAVTAAGAIVRLAVENDLTSITMPTLGGGRGGLNEAEVGVAMLPTIINTLLSLTSGRRSLETIILTAMEPETITALRRWFLRKPQSLRNDLAMGPDMLDITATAYALSDVLMLRELEPPLAVGVLGGWGSGKSFFMHLMQQRIAEIRSFAVSDQFPYIGHVYQIKFDAWTYAKSNLWASLMQTVFYELNDQLSREREVACILAEKRAEAADEPMDPNDSLLQAWLGSEQLWQFLALPDISLRQKEDLIRYLPELKEVLDRATAEEKNGDLLWNALRELKVKEQEALANNSVRRSG
jgi:hypothetical protein